MGKTPQRNFPCLPVQLPFFVQEAGPNGECALDAGLRTREIELFGRRPYHYNIDLAA
jgi:hypothetical protein